MNSQHFTIGILSTTAVVLFVGLLLTGGRTQPAQASGVTANSGQYIITVGTVSQNDEELVYIVDSVSQRMGVYRMGNDSKIDLIDGVELAPLRDAAGAPAGRSRRP